MSFNKFISFFKVFTHNFDKDGIISIGNALEESRKVHGMRKGWIT